MKPNPTGLLAFLHWNHDWNKFHFPDALFKKAVLQIRDLGVGMVRMDILWSDVYDGPGKTNFSRYNDRIQYIRDHGIEILAVLQYNKEHADNVGEVWNRPPKNPEEFAKYVYDTVAHFRHHISHWEIWNEPNHPVYWSKQDDNLKTYCELLKVSYQAVKSADAKAIVLNGGLAGPLIKSIEDLYRNGSQPYFDRLSIHPFMDPKSTTVERDFHALMNDVRRLMIQNGDEKKKIWITEMGCPGMPDPVPSKWFQGEGCTEADQAHWLKKQYTLTKQHPFIEKVFWAFYRDTDKQIGEGADYLGLVRLDMTPKPAFEVLKELIRSLSK